MKTRNGGVGHSLASDCAQLAFPSCACVTTRGSSSQVETHISLSDEDKRSVGVRVDV